MATPRSIGATRRCDERTGEPSFPCSRVAISGLQGLLALIDEQLRRFKADPDNHRQVMDRGLWHYTRHPNYFVDFCVWWACG